jgi:hypothetical protein
MTGDVFGAAMGIAAHARHVAESQALEEAMRVLTGDCYPSCVSESLEALSASRIADLERVALSHGLSAETVQELISDYVEAMRPYAAGVAFSPGYGAAADEVSDG